jgi:acetyl-CoA decarbonylase/synthase complex subunit gamma
MALTGIEIFKFLPKTNCGECGVPTCLAFAMKLAARQVELALCPYVSEEAKATLEEAAAPPIRVVGIGSGDDVFKVGGETVLFRHEKTFVNPPGIAVQMIDTMSDGEITARLDSYAKLQYERVGLTLKPDLIAIKSANGDASKMEALVEKAKSAGVKKFILISRKADVLSSALNHCAEDRPLLYAADKENIDSLGTLAKEKNCPLAVYGESLDEVTTLTGKLTEMGLKDLVIDSGARSLKQLFEDQVVIRRSALNNFRPLGFPTITFPCEMTSDPMMETLIAGTLVAKYAGIIVLSDLQGHALFPLLVERMNIYTDPQRPMATTEGIYEINNPTKDSPLIITSNFSLTYFIVSGEVESSRVPCWLLIKDTEGLSVLTGWAAGKFVADAIAPFVKKCGIDEKINHKSLVIPGAAAAISGELEEELPGWNIKIGPREAAYLTPYLKSWTAA